MSSRPTSVLTIAGITVVGLVAYALYFDYKRRNDVDFRKKLRKEKKRVDKTVSKAASEASLTGVISTDDLRKALEQVRNEEVPAPPPEKEAYFMTQVGVGEQLSIQGPEFHLAAAMAFFRALRVYPSPVELMVIYEKTVPPPIFKLVMDMTNLDVTSRVEGYYDNFPPKSFNVSVESREATGTQGARKVLVVNKDFKAGDIIYKEHPIVTALDTDVQAAGTHCSHCLRLIEPPIAIKAPQDPLSSVYCSKACQLASKTQSHNLLFTLERPLPSEIPMEAVSPFELEERRKAQTLYVEYIKKQNKVASLLAARLIARQIALETSKFVPGGEASKIHVEGDFTAAEGGDYVLADHLERLRFVDVTVSAEETVLLISVLRSALPGLESFVQDEAFKILLGKVAYNAYGVCFSGGRDDKPPPTQRPEDVERTRTPYGTSRQIGSAFYTLSSYLNHSCTPSARPSFSGGTSQLHLIANRDLKKGDELTVAFVDVTQHPGESVVDCRRRRRTELARGWKFACGCERCGEEAKTSVEGADSELDKQKDESKEEDMVRRYEDGDHGAADP